MSLRPYKFVVQAVCQQIDENDNPVAEVPIDPVQVFGCDGLAEWAAAFPDRLLEAEQEIKTTGSQQA